MDERLRDISPQAIETQRPIPDRASLAIGSEGDVLTLLAEFGYQVQPVNLQGAGSDQAGLRKYALEIAGSQKAVEDKIKKGEELGVIAESRRHWELVAEKLNGRLGDPLKNILEGMKPETALQYDIAAGVVDHLDHFPGDIGIELPTVLLPEDKNRQQPDQAKILKKILAEMIAVAEDNDDSLTSEPSQRTKELKKRVTGVKGVLTGLYMKIEEISSPLRLVADFLGQKSVFISRETHPNLVFGLTQFRQLWESGLLSAAQKTTIRQRLGSRIDLEKMLAAGKVSDYHSIVAPVVNDVLAKGWYFFDYYRGFNDGIEATELELAALTGQQRVKLHQTRLELKSPQGELSWQEENQLAATAQLLTYFEQATKRLARLSGEPNRILHRGYLLEVDDMPINLVEIKTTQGNKRLPSQRSDIAKMAHPNSVEVRFQENAFGQVQQDLAGAAMLNDLSVRELLTLALKRTWRETLARQMVGDVKNGKLPTMTIPKERAECVFEAICEQVGAQYRLEDHRPYLNKALSNQPIEGRILWGPLFKTAVELAQYQGADVPFYDLATDKPLWAMIACNAVGRIFDHLASFSPELQEQCLELLTIANDRLTVNDLLTLVEQAELKQPQTRIAISTEVKSAETRRLPKFEDVWNQLVDDFRGQEEALEDLILYGLDIVSRATVSCGYKDLDKRSDNGEKLNVFVGGPSGSGKSSGVRKVLKDGLGLDCPEINLTKVTEEGIKGEHEEDLVAKIIRDITADRGMTPQQVIAERINNKKVVVIYDEAIRLASGLSTGEGAERKRAAAETLYRLLDNVRNIVKVTIDGQTYEVNTEYISGVVVSSLGKAGLGQLAAVEAAEKGVLFYDFDEDRPVKSEDLVKLFEDIARRTAGRDPINFKRVTPDMLKQALYAPSTRNPVRQLLQRIRQASGVNTAARITQEAVDLLVERSAPNLKAMGYGAAQGPINRVYENGFQRHFDPAKPPREVEISVNERRQLLFTIRYVDNEVISIVL